MNALFVEGERATYVGADNERMNGEIVQAYTDASGFSYFTILLDSGREVQTVFDRLKKGEYTGVGAWQRVLDPNTECFYFFNDYTQETLWDTPESRLELFGEEQGQQEEEHLDQVQRPASPIAMELPPKRAPPSPQLAMNPRALVLAQSTDFRQALIRTGGDALERNLHTLGIQLPPLQPASALAQVLATAIAKVSLTLEEEDLYLLVHHCLGGRADTALLARSLSTHPEDDEALFLEDEQQQHQHSVVEEQEPVFAAPLPPPPPAQPEQVSFDRPPSRPPPAGGRTSSRPATMERPPSRLPPPPAAASHAYEQSTLGAKTEQAWYAEEGGSGKRKFVDEEELQRKQRWEEERRWEREEQLRRQYPSSRSDYHEPHRYRGGEEQGLRYSAPRQFYREGEEEQYLRHSAPRQFYRGEEEQHFRYSAPRQPYYQDEFSASMRARFAEDEYQQQRRIWEQEEEERRRLRMEDDRLFDDDVPFPQQQQGVGAAQEAKVESAPVSTATPVIDFHASKAAEAPTAVAAAMDAAPAVNVQGEEEAPNSQNNTDAAQESAAAEEVPKELPAALQDLANVQSDMDRLLESLANASKIDEDWRPQHDAAQQELQKSAEEIRRMEAASAVAAAPVPPPKQRPLSNGQQQQQQRVAPPPSKACGICTVM